MFYNKKKREKKREKKKREKKREKKIRSKPIKTDHGIRGSKKKKRPHDIKKRQRKKKFPNEQKFIPNACDNVIYARSVKGVIAKRSLTPKYSY